MSDKPKKNSPAMLKLAPGKYWWCACGKSMNQPFCDGSHKGSDISPLEFLIEEEGYISLCRCKRTKNPPFCDGSHSS